MRQIAALPYSINPSGGVDVCLVTSRGGGRWIIPKGNPVPGLAPHKAAAQEAREEAGLVGKAERRCIGTFEFDRIRGGRDESCAVDVYLFKIERQLRTWAEMDERMVMRCDVRTALTLISSPGLAALVRQHILAGPPLMRVRAGAH